MKELQAIARERKLRGYSRLRKAELITMLSVEEAVGKMHILPKKPIPNIETPVLNLFDEPVLNIETPVLQPTSVKSKPKLFSRVKQNLRILGNKIKADANTFADWFVSHVHEPMKKRQTRRLKR